MAEPLRRTVLLAVLSVLSVAACTSQEKLQETQLTELLAWMPGTYDGRAPTTVQGGVIMPHGAITMVVAKVYAPRLGHHVFYVQEMAADDPLRVLSQRMFSFKVDEKRGILETVYSFVEPLRWRDGQQNRAVHRRPARRRQERAGVRAAVEEGGGALLRRHRP